MSRDSIVKLLAQARRFYRAQGRAHLPWRQTREPYRIMVSEVMLQQTQVERVIPFYRAFLRKFPNVRALGKAPLSDVFALWSGLGYNRRARMLREAACAIGERFGGRFPRTVSEIESLPGIGPYTARAIAAFAFNRGEVFVETNIRTVFFHHTALGSALVQDAELLPLIAEALSRSKMEPREFYAMLMDYGNFLKRSGVRLNARSAHYARQSKFEGSRRQLRGRILKILLKGPQEKRRLTAQTERKASEVGDELARLQKEGLVVLQDKKYFLAP